MGFHLKPKNTLLPVEPGGDENVIGIRAFNIEKDVHSAHNDNVQQTMSICAMYILYYQCWIFQY